MEPLRTLGAVALLSAATNVATGAGPAALYDTHCSLCHQSAAGGAPGQFPRLAGRAGAAATDDRGRAYLVHVVRNGLSGTVVVDGAPLTGVMPAQSQLSPREIAQILNYLLSLPPLPHARPKPFTAAEVTSRTETISREGLLAERKALVEAGVLP